MVAVFTVSEALAAAALPVLPAEAGDELADPPDAAVLLLVELPQAAKVSIAAAKVVVTHHRLRIAYLHSHKLRYGGRVV
jgi:hypothetical protein